MNVLEIRVSEIVKRFYPLDIAIPRATLTQLAEKGNAIHLLLHYYYTCQDEKITEILNTNEFLIPI